MSRRKARELALQILFHLDFTGGSPREVIAAVYEMQEEPTPDNVREYVEWAVLGALAAAIIAGILLAIRGDRTRGIIRK